MRCETLYLKSFFPALGADGRDPFLQLYLPHNLEEMHREHQKRPCLLICPGGAYRNVSQREGEPVGLPFLTQGFNVFVLNYSTAPHSFPVQLQEIAAVMELIHQNADSWNCDPERVALMGFSAGGHLAAHYSNCYDCVQVRQMFPDSHPVQACILGYPVITADPKFWHKGSFVNLTGHDPVTEEDREKFSLERQVTEHTPPTFLWHTAEDVGVPVENTLLYAAALSACKIPFELHVYPYGAHGRATADEQTCDNLDEKVSHAHAWIEAVQKWLKLML